MEEMDDVSVVVVFHRREKKAVHGVLSQSIGNEMVKRWKTVKKAYNFIEVEAVIAGNRSVFELAAALELQGLTMTVDSENYEIRVF